MTIELLENGAEKFVTAGGVAITRQRHDTPYAGAIEAYIDGLNGRRGAVFSSNYEYPGRYTRWDTAIIDPPIVISARGRAMRIEALNGRGEILLPIIGKAVSALKDVTLTQTSKQRLALTIAEPGRIFTEEERSRVPSMFTVLRAITALFRSDQDSNLGLYGAFGYDLAFQFDPVDHALKRATSQRDLVLYLPDEILVVDHHQAKAWHDRYDYAGSGFSTEGLPRDSKAEPFRPSDRIPPRGDHEPGEYAKLVTKAMESFRRGDLFEVVPGQMFYERCETAPSEISRRLKTINPSPYSFFINLGEGEYLIGASPEMFVRVNGRRVETCPISGTIKRGDDAISDHEQILKLLTPRRTNPNSPCVRTSTATTSPGSASRARCASLAAARSRCIRASSTPSTTSKDGCAKAWTHSTPFFRMLGPSPSPARRNCGPCASSNRTKRARAPGMAARSAWCISTAT